PTRRSCHAQCRDVSAPVSVCALNTKPRRTVFLCLRVVSGEATRRVSAHGQTLSVGGPRAGYGAAVSTQLNPGANAGVGNLQAIEGSWVTGPMAAGRTHVHSRRFAACPICHLHLRSFANRAQEVADAGIPEVVFFHSPADTLRGYQSLLPFFVI